MASVSVANARKSYGHFEVLHGVDINIQDGEFVILVGPSGCGKSTLLRMIAGLEEISAGRISIGSKVVNNVAPKERDIAMVFQSYALYPHLTVEANMGFSLKLAKAPKEQTRQRVREAAEILGLGHLLDRYPKNLSGGQRQRVAMGRAIVRNPQVFLFDEPLSNLDAKLRVQMRSEIKQLHQRLKTTTIYVTHDQIEAMTMADRIVVMRDGFVEQIGSPLDLYDRPANLFVAGFIGSPAMNLIRGQVSTSGPLELIADGGGRLPLPEAASLERGAQLIYGIRPEHLTIGQGPVAVEVVLVEPTGAEIQVTTKFGEDHLVATVRERLDLRAGDRIVIAPDLSKLHLFDAKTEQRLKSV
ncbi:sn-glycerol-3-phosphate ABC transporter ATP-binding protein UgpC [Rhizobium laguerreae]|uniref:Multiple sugar transport system ATP-binding protein n=1 Tax=Rhizobium laguerreae TaxID=1076926 RepID=A0ABR6G9L1_9HYPH|nr:sn-glycerol-3-phosphate ABC transporter ATP-binding protein UgpC [Rhizobium laguerreae]MBB3162955.1 multiple sugar transport system ATP-binding protein [Rhizobium laguerreae]MBY3278021.1 sn-glycerol-3-phosphate ABC transporter ATP-binding protein UgpC [Rhizobium laguerreae]MBY3295985.1 sn-glycerol-3-phosphate ABC transporter ATP-binding protein UgpC [Rhizobium laguerreae]MBY3306795.1 sn-glycerol-3-phosphate ABC transporter ATP-binding protein UgpC [Rhizobium laguerreae]MBY3544368.1 sn-glyce